MSIVDETWASTVQAANVPVVGGNETETPFTTNPDFYSEGQTNDSVIMANVLTAKAAGANNLGTYYCAEAPSCQEGVAPLKAAGQKEGVPVVYNGEVAATAPNYTAQCVAAQQAHASAIFIGDASAVIARIGQNCAQQNYYPTYITEGEGFANVLLTAPGISKNLWSEYSTIPFFDTSVAGVQAMNTALDKYYPGIRSNPVTWSELGAEAWASGLLLRDAVKGGGLTSSATPSASEIVTGLDSLKGDTLDGMAPPLTFTAGGPHLIDCWFTAKVVNGTPSMVNNGQTTCSNG
jgi:branched-chain amino acid transport system substrate-binding protein